MKHILFFIVILSINLTLADEKSPMIDETMLCKNIENFYDQLIILKLRKGKGFDDIIENISYLILAAEKYSNGSPRLDEILVKLQKDYGEVPVSRHIMSSRELNKFILQLANDESGFVFQGHFHKIMFLSEFIHNAKQEISKRSGFKFTEVPVRRSQ
ncbi:MAG: hypothetical protein PHV34_10890 [Verrucomicrobiae bacterium]|nr:hypothetical protein [Verrucomicrobiae bacterium]